MNTKAIISAAVGALVALVVYDMFVKDLLGKSSFDANL